MHSSKVNTCLGFLSNICGFFFFYCEFKPRHWSAHLTVWALINILKSCFARLAIFGVVLTLPLVTYSTQDCSIFLLSSRNLPSHEQFTLGRYLFPMLSTLPTLTFKTLAISLRPYPLWSIECTFSCFSLDNALIIFCTNREGQEIVHTYPTQ